ncbi:DinB family protein [Citricoccus sp. SGAir0253]|uniref:DinB family protein n=1 Tax=Citricoccus sp. SGAir0253 TaxID=2567881 RepID=UPI0010CCE352|nr:DinB family protein [Citricoccus sp. SGAir0253]QCU79170.1 DinB family protein [Citricoccus sp. SGAir0253]
MNTPAPAPVPADDRDWTAVITDGCAECGFRPFDPAQVADRIREGTRRWLPVLQRPDVAVRPVPEVWSPLEYACHVRDMVRLLGERVKSMRDQQDPVLADWDGNAKAVQLAYWAADPGTTWEDLERSTRRTVAILDSVPAQDRGRPGRRSDGTAFTIDSLGQYIGHEMEHHLHDVRG